MAGRKQRRRAARGVVGALIAALLLVAAAPARADVWDQIDRNTSVAFDLVVLRPLNAAALVLGGILVAIVGRERFVRKAEASA